MSSSEEDIRVYRVVANDEVNPHAYLARVFAELPSAATADAVATLLRYPIA